MKKKLIMIIITFLLIILSILPYKLQIKKKSQSNSAKLNVETNYIDFSINKFLSDYQFQ